MVGGVDGQPFVRPHTGKPSPAGVETTQLLESRFRLDWPLPALTVLPWSPWLPGTFSPVMLLFVPCVSMGSCPGKDFPLKTSHHHRKRIDPIVAWLLFMAVVSQPHNQAPGGGIRAPDNDAEAQFSTSRNPVGTLEHEGRPPGKMLPSLARREALERGGRCGGGKAGRPQPDTVHAGHAALGKL